MTPIVILIGLMFLVALFYFGFAHNQSFLYFASIFSILLGLFLLVGGFAEQTGYVEELDGNTTTVEYTYTENTTQFSYVLSLSLILLGMAFIYYDRYKKENNEEAIRGNWL